MINIVLYKFHYTTKDNFIIYIWDINLKFNYLWMLPQHHWHFDIADFLWHFGNIFPYFPVAGIVDTVVPLCSWFLKRKWYNRRAKNVKKIRRNITFNLKNCTLSFLSYFCLILISIKSLLMPSLKKKTYSVWELCGSVKTQKWKSLKFLYKSFTIVKPFVQINCSLSTGTDVKIGLGDFIVWAS